MLVTVQLQPYSKKTVIGDLVNLESSLYQDILCDINISQFKDKPVIIKGCSNKPVPENAYIMLISRLKTVAKSVMYGEACSSVPIYKRK